jgi:hypothetical protein
VVECNAVWTVRSAADAKVDGYQHSSDTRTGPDPTAGPLTFAPSFSSSCSWGTTGSTAAVSEADIVGLRVKLRGGSSDLL